MGYEISIINGYYYYGDTEYPLIKRGPYKSLRKCRKDLKKQIADNSNNTTIVVERYDKEGKQI